MELMPSQTILDSNLLACNIPEDDYTAHVLANSYTIGQLVRVVGVNIHRIYLALQDVPANTALDNSAYWLHVNTTNRFNLFDHSITSQAAYPALIDFTLGNLQRGNALYFGNLDASEVQIIVRDASNVIKYNKTYATVKKRGVVGFHTMFFGDRVRIRDLYVNDLPYYANGTVQVMMRKPGGTVKCGICEYGLARKYGDTQFGLQFGISDYSAVNVDKTFGFATFVKRDAPKQNSYTVEVPNNMFDEVNEVLTDLRATFCLFVGAKNFQSTYVFGYYTDFKNILSYPTSSLLYLKIEGTI